MDGVGKMNDNFWKDKTVLITGNTGFKGSWASFWLYKMGAKVTGFALNPPTNPNFNPPISTT